MRLRIYLLIVLAIVFAFLSGVFILGDQKSHKLEPSEYMTIFENKKYNKLIDRLSSLQHVIVKGKDEDGVDLFVNYALNVTLPEEHTVNQRSLFAEQSQLQDVSYALFSKIRNFLIKSIDQTVLNQVWVIDCNGSLTQEHGSALNELIAQYPNDRVIVIAPEVQIKLPNYKTINFFRPEDQVVENLLKKQGLTGQQIRIVLQNHKNNLEQLQISYDQGSLLDHQEAFKAQKVIVTNQLQATEAKILGYLKKLCRYGKLPTKSQINELDAMQAVEFDQNGYYWFSKNYLQAYESIVGIHCQDPEIFIETKNVDKQVQQEVTAQQTKTQVTDQTTQNQQTQSEEQNTIQQVKQVKNKQKIKPKKKSQKQKQSKVEIKQVKTEKSKDKVNKKQKISSSSKQQQQKAPKKKVEKVVVKEQKPKKNIKPVKQQVKKQQVKKQQVKKQQKKEVKKQIQKPKQKQQKEQKIIKKVVKKQTVKLSQKPVKQIEVIATKIIKTKQLPKSIKHQKQKLTNKNTKQTASTKQSSKKSKQTSNKKQKKDQKKKR